MKTRFLERFIERFRNRLRDDAQASIEELGPDSRETQRWKFSVTLLDRIAEYAIEVIDENPNQPEGDRLAAVWGWGDPQQPLVKIFTSQPANISAGTLADLVIRSLNHLGDFFISEKRANLQRATRSEDEPEGFTPDTEMVVSAPPNYNAESFKVDVKNLNVYHVRDGTPRPQSYGHAKPGTLLELVGLVFALEREGTITRRARDLFAAFITSHAPWS